MGMWLLTIRSPGNAPREHILHPGKTTLGRKSDNTIVINDQSASRYHAEIYYAPQADTITVTDTNSTNGTFVNHQRLVQPQALRAGDQIRIGEHLLRLDYLDDAAADEPQRKLPMTRALTRELLIEALDCNAVLLSEAARRLNNVLDLNTALSEVADMMRPALGADKCEVILAEHFDELHRLGFPISFARLALEQRSAVIIPDLDALADPAQRQSAMLLKIRSALCVPVLNDAEILALIYAYKTRPLARPFDTPDLQLAVGISHQMVLAIQRTRLTARIHKEQRARQMLQRFLSPAESENLLRDYLESGKLPELTERNLTTVFTDLQDSTGLAERVGARRFSEILGRYYQDMTNIVFDYGGLMNKYLGDGLMAVFGLNPRQSDAERRAVDAGLTILEAMDAFNRELVEPLVIGVGVNSGEVIAGYLGTIDRVEFTVLGDVVNVARWLNVEARPNRLIIGPTTYAAVVNGRFNIRPIGPISVKRRSQPLEAYEVMRHSPPPA